MLVTKLRSQARKLFLYFIFLLLVFERASSAVNITVAVIMERSPTDMPFGINRTIGVINNAIDKSKKIVNQSINLNFIIRYTDVPTCTYFQFGALAAEIYYTSGSEINAIIGPGCSNAVTSIARLTAAWNLPHITYGGTSEDLGNKANYRTLTRIAYNLNVFAEFYMEVFREFSWTDIANIYDASSFLGRLSGQSLQKSFIGAGVKSYDLPFSTKVTDLHTELLRVLNNAKTVSRVFLVSCHGNFLRKIALLAPHIGIDRGDYSIIYFLSDPLSGYIGNYSWNRGDELDMDAKVAYESVMLIRPRRPNSVEFLKLEDDIKRQAMLLYNFSWKPDSEMGIFNIAQYDAFILYAHVLNEAIEAGDDPRVSSNILHRLWNRTFPGIAGTTFINEMGDRETDFTLLDMDPETGEFLVNKPLHEEKHKPSQCHMRPVNTKAVAQHLGYTHVFELLPDASIHWPNRDSAHPNMPPCGFVGELCSTYTFPLIGSVALGFTGLIILIVTMGTLYFRRMQAEAAVLSDWWRIKWEDVKINNQARSLSAGSVAKNTESESMSLAPVYAASQRRAIFKGETVHITKPKIKFLSIDRKLMLELKQMRDINCPNLTRLIGLCPEKNNVCIITEYCSRGKLQDILHNKSIQLEKEFRTSLINDIVQGMHYLHNCPIGVHGFLTSSTCVIDSRFVLKITGFGLPSLNNNNENEMDSCEVNNYFVPDLLWMAPEMLRNYPPRKVSQQGDVYSFAIILYEMCTRNEPYISEPWYQSIEDTVEQIKLEQPYPRRPAFQSTSSFPEIAKLATECWKENPTERPTFVEIRKWLQDVRRGNNYGKNVLDMLLHRMEQYANNLEGLVEERTNAFLEEKKRSEELLYQVLPRSVADQLRCGQMVVPEEFNNVTVYFSDIVGFTTISASSTPFEVVALLNDVYTCFDEIIDNYNVYKVETIGDAYMVVSGLPIRNANEHVREIARMSLQILRQLQQFVIQHQPETPLKARIGIHSGPVVAGVVGRKMPRYCLFGDTVNTASRMESNGLPMKIHISSSTRELLETFSTFVIEERGLIDIKGKGAMLTHWLLEELHV